MLIREAVELWLRRKKRALSAKQGEHVDRLSKGWLAAFGDLEVGAVTVAHVEARETERDDGTRSGSALNQERGYLRQFFRWCIQNGWRTEDPTITWVFRSTVVKREYVELTLEQEEALIAACRTDWMKRYVRISLLTGLRQGTIRQLTWDMVRESEILIPASIMKTRTAHSFPITERLRAALGERSSGLLFPGLPEASSLYRMFQRAAHRAGVPAAASPHDMRRTWVARLSEAGVPLQTVMALGAWKTLGTLLGHYSSRATRKAALAALETV